MSAETGRPHELAGYLAARDRQRNEQVTEALEALTPTQRSLIKEAAVMGYVQGRQAPQDDVPPDSVILHGVVAACLAMPDLYPTINGVSEHSDVSGLHAQLTEAATQWVLMYPFANWGFWGAANADARDQLSAIAREIAAAWGETIADATLAIVQPQLDAKDAEIERLTKERNDARALVRAHIEGEDQ